MKKIIFFLVLIFLPIMGRALDIESKNAYLYQMEDDKVLYEKNSEEEISIASLTKIMTAIVAIENNDLDKMVQITGSDFKGLYEVGASTAGFRIGETVSIKDLLYGLLLPSGAEAAQALSRTTFDSRDTFIAKMNEKAEELGLVHTHFKNETGLDEDGHVSTVKDVFILFLYALENETFKTILETENYQTTNGLKLSSTISKVKNQLQMGYLKGGKTGTTRNAGLCLASYADIFSTTYILVTCGAPNDWQTPRHIYDARTVYQYVMDAYERKNIVLEHQEIYTLKTKYAKESEINVYVPQTIQKIVPKDSNETLEVIYEGVEEVSAFTKQNEHLGKITLQYEQQPLLTFDVVLENRLTIDWFYFLQKYGWMILVVLFILGFIFGRIFKRKRRV